MEVILQIAQYEQDLNKPMFKKCNSLDCNCEKKKINKKDKPYSICDICSENKILRKTSTNFLDTDSSTFSDD